MSQQKVKNIKHSSNDNNSLKNLRDPKYLYDLKVMLFNSKSYHNFKDKDYQLIILQNQSKK